jgi:hypothetical protein
MQSSSKENFTPNVAKQFFAPKAQINKKDQIDLNDWKMDDFTNIRAVGSGKFGKVF